jgi:hypothetical protein
MTLPRNKYLNEEAPLNSFRTALSLIYMYVLKTLLHSLQSWFIIDAIRLLEPMTTNIEKGRPLDIVNSLTDSTQGCILSRTSPD